MISSVTGNSYTITEEWITIPSNTAVDLLTLVSQSMWYKTALAIHRYYYPCIIILGMIGNILSFMVMLMKHNRRISCCVYMGVVAVADSLCLILGSYYWILTVSPPILPRSFML